MEKNTCSWLIGADNEETRGGPSSRGEFNNQERNSFFACCAFWKWLTDSNCTELPWKQTFPPHSFPSFFFLYPPPPFFFLEKRGLEAHKLTGQAKLKGKTIRDLSFLTELLKEKVFPPRTGVDPVPKLQGPAAETLDWYSFRQTLKNVSHSSRVHFRSPVFRAPSQHRPLSNSPFTLCMDKICNSNCPVPWDTCWETETGGDCKGETFKELKKKSFKQ